MESVEFATPGWLAARNAEAKAIAQSIRAEAGGSARGNFPVPESQRRIWGASQASRGTARFGGSGRLNRELSACGTRATVPHGMSATDGRRKRATDDLLGRAVTVMNHVVRFGTKLRRGESRLLLMVRGRDSKVTLGPARTRELGRGTGATGQGISKIYTLTECSHPRCTHNQKTKDVRHQVADAAEGPTAEAAVASVAAMSSSPSGRGSTSRERERERVSRSALRR